MKINSNAAVRLLSSLAVVCTLGGCAVYGTTPGYYDYGDQVYTPAPVYVAPAYVGPPVFLNFGFRSGGSWGHGYHGHWRGVHGGGGHFHRGR